MKRFLFAAAVAAAFLSAPPLQAQTSQKAQPAKTAKKAKVANTSAAPAAAQPTAGWGWGDARAERAAPEAAGWAEPAAVAGAPGPDPMMQSSGVLVAPGMSSSPYRGTSTDYHGRPVVKAKSRRPRSVKVAHTDPLMQSSGVLVAPGMNTAPYRAASTDYHGRPLRKTSTNTTVSAREPAPTDNSTVASGW